MWRRWDTPQDFFLAFIDELEKQLFIKKNLLKWASKKSNNVNIYNVVFLKTMKKNTWKYHYFTIVYWKSWWYDIQFLRYRAWQINIGNFGSFFALLPSPLKTWKIRILKKQSYWQYHHFMCTKNHNHMMYSF